VLGELKLGHITNENFDILQITTLGFRLDVTTLRTAVTQSVNG
jgi:hypothetical protein